MHQSPNYPSLTSPPQVWPLLLLDFTALSLTRSIPRASFAGIGDMDDIYTISYHGACTCTPGAWRDRVSVLAAVDVDGVSCVFIKNICTGMVCCAAAPRPPERRVPRAEARRAGHTRHRACGNARRPAAGARTQPVAPCTVAPPRGTAQRTVPKRGIEPSSLHTTKPAVRAQTTAHGLPQYETSCPRLGPRHRPIALLQHAFPASRASPVVNSPRTREHLWRRIGARAHTISLAHQSRRRRPHAARRASRSVAPLRRLTRCPSSFGGGACSSSRPCRRWTSTAS